MVHSTYDGFLCTGATIQGKTVKPTVAVEPVHTTMYDTRVAYQVDTNHVAGGIVIIPPPPLGWYRWYISVGITFVAMVGIPPFLPSLSF